MTITSENNPSTWDGTIHGMAMRNTVGAMDWDNIVLADSYDQQNEVYVYEDSPKQLNVRRKLIYRAWSGSFKYRSSNKLAGRIHDDKKIIKLDGVDHLAIYLAVEYSLGWYPKWVGVLDGDYRNSKLENIVAYPNSWSYADNCYGHVYKSKGVWNAELEIDNVVWYLGATKSQKTARKLSETAMSRAISFNSLQAA
jgi:hypothetical protein